MKVKHIDIDDPGLNLYPKKYVGCVVLTKDNKILLQQRGSDWDRYPDYLVEFGGKIEPNETPMNALIRELKEEIGAEVNEKDVVSFGAVTEDDSNYTELIYVYFWHDNQGTITGCYEGKSKTFDNVNEVLKQSKTTAGLRWLLNECQERGLVK